MNQVSLTMAVALVIGETAVVEKGAMLYRSVGTRKDTGKASIDCQKDDFEHAQVIGLLSGISWDRCSGVSPVLTRCDGEVGVPIKLSSVHGEKKDEPTHLFTKSRGETEYYLKTKS